MLRAMAEDDLESLLHADHERVDDLFAEIRASDAAAQRAVLDRIILELKQHAGEEERVVYAEVRRSLGDELADHEIDEHQGLRETLVALNEATPGTAAFDALLRSLMTDVADHVSEEEREILPLLRNTVGDARWAELARQYTSERAGDRNHASPGRR